MNTRFFHVARIFFAKLCVVLLLCMVVPIDVFASTILLQPNPTSVNVGKTFVLPVYVDPTEEAQYTAMLTIIFSSEKVEVVSFVFANNWLPIPQAGYDLVDNKKGELIKTAGFPKGFSKPTLFGTILFRAKQTGDAMIEVGLQSFILNEQSQNTLTTLPKTTVKIRSLPPPAIEEEKQLPTKPTEVQNLFDVSIKTLSYARSNLVSLTILFVIGIILGVVAVMQFERWRRRRILTRLYLPETHEKDFQKK